MFTVRPTSRQATPTQPDLPHPVRPAALRGDRGGVRGHPLLHQRLLGPRSSCPSDHAIAALGLNILTGYRLVSLPTVFIDSNHVVLKPALSDLSIYDSSGGGITRLSACYQTPHRIRAFYGGARCRAVLPCPTLNRLPWFSLSAGDRLGAHDLNVSIDKLYQTFSAKYLFCLSSIRSPGWRTTTGTVGRKWMAIRDMDIAAEIIGNPLTTKLCLRHRPSISRRRALFFSVHPGAVGSARDPEIF